MIESEAREALVEGGRRLLAEGLVARTWGNLSLRLDDGGIAITPSGIPYGDLTAEMIVRMDPETGEWSGPWRPSGERKVHLEVYRRRPEVQAVVHTHQMAASICAAARSPLPASSGTVPCAAYALPGTKKLTTATVGALGDGPAVLMANHGALTVGGDLDEAFQRIVALERDAAQHVVSWRPREGSHLPADADAPWEATWLSPVELRDGSTAWLSAAPFTVRFSMLRRALPPVLDDVAQVAGRQVGFTSRMPRRTPRARCRPRRRAGRARLRRRPRGCGDGRREGRPRVDRRAGHRRSGAAARVGGAADAGGLRPVLRPAGSRGPALTRVHRRSAGSVLAGPVRRRYRGFMEFVILAALIVAAVLLFRSGSTKREVSGSGARAVKSRENEALAARRWTAVRRVAEEDVTQLGQQIASTPVPDSIAPEAAQDFDDALEAYERAKETLAVADHPDDLQWVSRSLDDGRFALAKLDARTAGRELPNRRPPCFFDQRHGLSVTDALWAPEGGVERDVPVCAACDAQIKDGVNPQARMVPTAAGDRPYYDAGAEYGPWARGWYGASGMYMLNGMLMGTMLMHAMYLPAGYDYFSPAGDSGDGGGDGGDGGDAGGDGVADAGGADGGGDFGGGDFGGGGFDGGGFDFGGF